MARTNDNQIRAILVSRFMRRFALALVIFLPLVTLARPDACENRCADDKKNCELQCSKKAGKHAAQCKNACTQLTDPCRADCKAREGKRK
jgi:hypothetical protein